MNGIYEQFRDACANRETTLTQVLIALGKATGSTGSWKAGKFPQLDTAMEIAEYLHISLDELCYGKEKMKAAVLSESDREWLCILSRIPADKRQMCKDFLSTHMVAPEKYVDKKNA